MPEPKTPAAKPAATRSEPVTPAAPAFQIVRPCVAGETTYQPGDEQRLLEAKLAPGVLKVFLLTNAIVGTIPGIAIEEEDRRALFAPPVEG